MVHMSANQSGRKRKASQQGQKVTQGLGFRVLRGQKLGETAFANASPLRSNLGRKSLNKDTEISLLTWYQQAGPSWLYLGAILGLCWVLLGRLGPMLAQLGTTLGVPGFYVGPSWLYLGAILGLCWVLLGRLGPMLAHGTMLGVPGFYVGPS